MLIICEKDIAARRIAEILSDGKAGRSWSNRSPTYTWGDCTVIGLRGHILSLDYPPQYAQWSATDPRELVWVEPIKKLNAPSIVKALRGLAAHASTVIVATDYDREGELIGVESLDIIQEVTKDAQVRRAHFSSLAPQEIKKAFSNLGDVNYNLAAAAKARQLIDLAWGASLTRVISLAPRRGKVISVGRVQSPTLALIVQRDREVKAFKPTTYWELVTRVKGLLLVSERFLSEQEAQAALSTCKKVSETRASVHRSLRKERPPPPFDTTAFLQAATRLGISASRAMQIAERLYVRGYISYPRTDNTAYPKALSLRGVLARLPPPFQEAASELSKRKLVPTIGKKIAWDHPPIYPSGAPQPNELDKEEWRVYELVVRRFLATLAPPAEVERTKVEVSIASYPFSAQGDRYVDRGWYEYYPYVKLKETMMPPMRDGGLVSIEDIVLRTGETKPPKRYTQGTLIGEMERLGLGTKSTRHEIIGKLYARRYLQGNPPLPTDVGIVLIEALSQYATEIMGAEMTSKLEQQMDDITKGDASLEEVVRESRTLLEGVLEEVLAHEREIGGTIRETLAKQDQLGTCPSCGGAMVLRRSKGGKRFVGCSNYPKCTQTYPLPQRGLVVGAGPCERCGAPRIRIVIGKRRWISCLNPDCRKS